MLRWPDFVSLELEVYQKCHISEQRGRLGSADLPWTVETCEAALHFTKSVGWICEPTW